MWVIGGAVLIAAGFATALLPRLRSRRRARQVAWSAARAAIDSAAVSRDASSHRVPAAEQLLAQAELIAAGGGGVAAAQKAAAQAQRADQFWREASEAASPEASDG